MMVKFEYTEEEKLLNKYRKEWDEAEKAYQELREKLLHDGKCIEIVDVDGMMSHLVNGKEHTVIERNENGDPIRWRFHKYLNAEEMESLKVQLNNN